MMTEENIRLLDYLRENLSIEISMDDNYESGGRYVSCSATLRLGDVISTDYDSIRVGDCVVRFMLNWYTVRVYTLNVQGRHD